MTRERSPGSNPHEDRRNWRPAETFEEYLSNCREGLEDYSASRAARVAGVSRAELWRWGLMAELPEELFERLLARCREAGIPPTAKTLANISMYLRGADAVEETETCPCCGHVLRQRPRVQRELLTIVEQWLMEQRG
jgi:hypothetical protein